MKVLLGEDLPVRLRFNFQAAEVETAEYLDWQGLGNGALLRAAHGHFDVLITMDNNLPEQQPLRQFDIAVENQRHPGKTLEDLAPQYACILSVHS